MSVRHQDTAHQCSRGRGHQEDGAHACLGAHDVHERVHTHTSHTLTHMHPVANGSFAWGSRERSGVAQIAL